MSQMPPKSPVGDDTLQTPEEAMFPLLPGVHQFNTVWEPASPENSASQVAGFFLRRGFGIIESGLPNTDFFEVHLGDLVAKPDCIVTNPPYSLKTRWLARCYDLGLPFALLLPITVFDSKARQRMFEKHGVQIIYMDRRIQFMTESGKNAAWFMTCWVTWKFNLPREINFYHLPERDT